MQPPAFVDHIVIIVADVKETERFYTVFLGKPIHSDAESVAYKVGETKLFFAVPSGKFEKIDKDRGSLNHFALGVRTSEELKRMETLLDEAGIKQSGIQIDRYGNNEFIWFDDPDGYRVEFYCRALEP